MTDTSFAPHIDLSTFVLSVSSAAMMGLGVIPQFQTQKSEVNLTVAKQNIDLLELLYEKTKGNRTPEEEQLFEKVLFDTRMRFIEVQQEQKKTSPGS